RKNLTEKKIIKGIDHAFTHAKYCILTKEESRLLDGAGQKFSNDEIEKILSEYKKLPKEEEDDYRNIEGKSKKSSGFGAIRLFVLQNAKVEFVNSSGEEQSFGDCVAYLEDGKYTTI
ncbi:MAG: hypothetical protein IKI90_08440, partial [Treponema sp.]|nr:hypothetical protein [Treponema sp.]